MTPSTIIDTLKAKLHLGNVRAEGNAAKVVLVQEEHLALELGRCMTIGYNPLERYWKPT